MLHIRIRGGIYMYVSFYKNADILFQTNDIISNGVTRFFKIIFEELLAVSIFTYMHMLVYFFLLNLFINLISFDFTKGCGFS